jgi:hypothetical protein
MARAYTIIDSFRITEALRERLDALPCGVWFVLEGTFNGAAELPAPGTPIVVVAPDGERFRAVVVNAEVRHGAATVSFSPQLGQLPRLSVFSVTDNGL